MLEELIYEDKPLRDFHPLSVNTLRIVTFFLGDKIKCVFPVLRMGRGKSIVDNSGQGGLIAIIDIDTGVIDYVTDEFGKFYAVHPDTGISFSGFLIPQFASAIKLCMELASQIPENRYCSWDLALSNGSWVLVEGNASGKIIWQIGQPVGIRTILNGLCNEAHIQK